MQQARDNLELLKEVFALLDVPIAVDKLVGPATVVTYLGIEINTVDFTISIPEAKVQQALQDLPNWCTRRTCKKRELLSLIGILSFFAIVVRPGRIFVRRLINLSTTVKELHHFVTLSSEAKKDIRWWYDFLPSWNKSSIIPDPLLIKSSDIQLFTDAARYKGLGAVMGNSWIQSDWPPDLMSHNIDFKELFAILAATYTWGSRWSGKRIVFITDNKPITQIWASGTTPSPDIMVLIRKLFLFAATHDFSISFKHVFGHYNPVADALSRFQEKRFCMLMPDADAHATPIPTSVWKLGILQQRHKACST